MEKNMVTFEEARNEYEAQWMAEKPEINEFAAAFQQMFAKRKDAAGVGEKELQSFTHRMLFLTGLYWEQLSAENKSILDGTFAVQFTEQMQQQPAKRELYPYAGYVFHAFHTKQLSAEEAFLLLWGYLGDKFSKGNAKPDNLTDIMGMQHLYEGLQLVMNQMRLAPEVRAAYDKRLASACH